MTKSYTVRTNCEYSTQVVVRDDQGKQDAITVADRTPLANWDQQAWTPMEAEEETAS